MTFSTSIGNKYFNSNPPQQQPPPAPQQLPPRGMIGKSLDTVKRAARGTLDATNRAVKGTLWGITRPISWAFNPIGDGIGSGAASGVKREFEQMIQPNSPIISQLQESVEQALLKQPPEEFLQLRELLKKAHEHSDKLTVDDLQIISLGLNDLLNENAKMLKHLAPNLSPTALQLFQKMAKLFENPADEEMNGEELEDTYAIINIIVEENQGALIRAMSFLQQALLSEEHGLISEAIEILKRKATDEHTGLMKQIVDQLTQLLNQQGGPLDLLTHRLTVGDKSIIGEAITLLKKSLFEDQGIVNELGKRFNDEQEGIIVKALAIAKTSIDATLKDGLAFLKDSLTAEDGLMTTLKQQISGNKDSVLKQAIDLLNECLYDPKSGMVANFRRELTDKEQGILVEALKVFGNALNDEKEGILVQGIDLLKEKFNGEEGVVAEALRLLEHKLNGKDGIVENLKHRLINEHDGALTKALALLQEKLNDENKGLIADAMSLMEKRLLAEDGLVSSLEKRLTDAEKGTLTKVVESMKKALEKKDGPLDLLKQEVQTLLDQSIEILKKKCLDEKEGIFALALELATKKLHEENGLLDTLSKRLNDPKHGIIAKAIETLSFKILEDNGPFDLFQKRLLDEKEGPLAQAIDLLTRKLEQKDGPLGAIQKRLIDKDGILDQAINMLHGRLTDPDKGILIQAKQYLSAAINDEKTGILVQAIDLLKVKLNEKDGVMDLIDTRLNHEETGILTRAACVLQKKLMAKGGLVDELENRFTGEAHPLLSNARQKLTELRKVIGKENKREIRKLSGELQQSLEQLTANQALVFNKEPLSSGDKIVIDQLREQLPTFSSEAPPDQSAMLIVVEAGLAVINRYYGSLEGTAARIGTILQEKIVDVVDPLFEKVENKVNHFLGRDPEGASESAATDGTVSATGGTVSQFLDMGGSALKHLLSKGAQSISKQVFSSFASVLSLGIQYALNNMEDTPTLRGPREKLNQIMSTLNAVQENNHGPNLYQAIINSDLYKTLSRTAEAFKPLKICVNGFYVPHGSMDAEEPTGNADKVYSNHITALQKASNSEPIEPVNQDWKTLANAEKDKLISNATKFLTIKHIYEEVCKLKPPDERFYMRLLEKSKEKGVSADAELKTLFFAELEKNKVGFVKRTYAQIQYYFYSVIVNHLVKKATTAYFEEIFKYIEVHKEENFDTLRGQMITNSTRYLTILGEAYRNVAKNSNPTGTLDEMLQKELDKKDSNLGFETKDLYAEFTQSVIHKTIGKGFLGWIAEKWIAHPEEIVRSIIDKTLGSMQDPYGYSHALNNVIREQLEEILAEVLKRMRDDPAQQGDPTNTLETSDLKDEVKGLVKNLFEILNKSKCQTKDELRKLIKEEILSAKINKAIDDLFIEEVLGKITQILSVSVLSLVKEDQLQKFTYKFALLLNQTFEVGKEVTYQQKRDEERKIGELSNQILRLVVNAAVEEKFDFTGEKQQKETNGYVSNLHNRSIEFFTTTRQDLAALLVMNFSSAEGKNKTDKIIEDTLAYQSQCYESNYQVKSSHINSDNKDEVAKRYFGIAQQSQPLVQAVTQLKQHSKALENILSAVPHLDQIKTIATEIPGRLFYSSGLTHENLTYCENQLQILDTHLKELKNMRNYTQLAQQIEVETRLFATLLIDLRKATQTNSFCIAQTQTGSLLEQIAGEKKRSLGATSANAALQGKLALLKQEVLNSFNTTYHAHLLEKVRMIEEATVSEQVDIAYREFLGICQQAMSHAAVLTQKYRDNYYQSLGRAMNAISDSHLLEPSLQETEKRGMRESIALAQQHLNSLATWEEQHIKEIPYVNFPLGDMKWFHDVASGLVFNRVKERLDGLIGFLKQEETYRYGVLNHLFLIPYVKAMQEPKNAKRLFRRG